MLWELLVRNGKKSVKEDITTKRKLCCRCDGNNLGCERVKDLSNDTKLNKEKEKFSFLRIYKQSEFLFSFFLFFFRSLYANAISYLRYHSWISIEREICLSQWRRLHFCMLIISITDLVIPHFLVQLFFSFFLAEYFSNRLPPSLPHSRAFLHVIGSVNAW